ncbi:hypothetical protein [Spiroplasma sp. DGKH1]|uniref:hypothetical protein n=1 Tax=Spiroplasma sp. DGKH1 TaxID=3050074 RepID=UPI0034C696A5
MGIGRGIAWALGLVPESAEKASKRMYKEQQKQSKKNKLRVENILGSIELYGYLKTVEEYTTLPEKLWPMTKEEVTKIWSTNLNIKDKVTGKTYSEYFSSENNQNSNQLKQELLDKEKEILELKLKLMEAEKNR